MNCKVCENTSVKKTSVSFFRFPKENVRCKDWAKRCNLLKSYQKHGTLTFYKSFRICSDHFDPKDIVFDGRKKRLLQLAVPRYFLNRKSEQKQETAIQTPDRNMKLGAQVYNLCRLCAEEGEDLTDIFGKRGQTMDLETKLKYFPLVVNKCDVLPLRVCHQCISKVNQYSDFIKNCMRAESKLKIMLDMENVDDKTKTVDFAHYNAAPEQNESLNYNITDIPSYQHVFLPRNEGEQISLALNLGNCYLAYSSQPESEQNRISFENDPVKSNAFNVLINQSIIDVKHDLDLSKNNTGEQVNSKSREQLSSIICHQNQELPNGRIPAPETQNMGDESVDRLLEFDESFLKENCFVSMDQTSTKCQNYRSGTIHQEAFQDDEQSPEGNLNKNPSSLYFYSFRPLMDEIRPIVINNYSKPNNPEFACQFCDKRFTTRKLWKTHQNIHAVTSTYQCKVCGKVLRSKSSLRQHRSVHSDKRLFSCQECGMSFKRKDTLCNHRRIHTGERPFVCKICGFAFKQRGDCLKHEKNHMRNSYETGKMETDKE